MGLNKIDWNKYFGDWCDNRQWKEFLSTRYMYSVLKYLSQEYKTKVIFPRREDIFKCFKLCSIEDVKVVILGNEPYTDGKATGLAYANPPLGRLNSDLQQIRNSLERDLYSGMNLNFNPTLENWAEQGVLLLNTSLTSQKGVTRAHEEVWDKFIRFVLSYIAEYKAGTVVLFWGEDAQKYRVIDGFDIVSTCYLMKGKHPSESTKEDRDWHCSHFSETNKLLRYNNGKECSIEW